MLWAIMGFTPRGKNGYNSAESEPIWMKSGALFE